jgi:hypothetical protein
MDWLIFWLSTRLVLRMEYLGYGSRVPVFDEGARIEIAFIVDGVLVASSIGFGEAVKIIEVTRVRRN